MSARPALTLNRQADAEKATLLAKLDELSATVEARDDTLQQAAARIHQQGNPQATRGCVTPGIDNSSRLQPV
jgi:uncharacterized membrane protein